MKIISIILTLLFYSQVLSSQVIDIKGTLIVYYSYKSDTLITDYYGGYCLDSIRFIDQKESIPVGGYIYGKERFAYQPIEDVDYVSTFLDQSRFYSAKYGHNILHEGGEIFAKKNMKYNLYIAFNITGKGYLVLPEINSTRNDFLSQVLEKSVHYFKDQYGIDPCAFSVNEGQYIFLLQGLKSYPLRRKERKCFGFIKSVKKSFINYGIL